MDLFSIIFLAIALAMDAFGVSVTNGLILKKVRIAQAAKVGFFFGFFQFIMPCIGSGLACIAYDHIKSIDHWIAFILLLILGVKMIYDAHSEEKELCKNPLEFGVLVVMAIATSIDALAAGITVAAVGVPVLLPATIIGIVAFAFSFSGMFIGSKCGDVLGEKAEIIGGIMLILIGTKTLAEHLIG